MTTANSTLSDDNKNKRLHLIFAIISAMLIILLVFFVQYIEEAKRINSNEVLRYENLNYIDELTNQILIVETNVQSYLLTNDDSYIAPFYLGINRLQRLLTSNEWAWPNHLNAAEIVALEDNIDKVTQQLNAMIKRKNLNQNDNASDCKESKIVMSSLSEQIIKIRKTIQVGFQQNQQSNVSTLNLIKWAMLGLSIIAFSLLIVLFFQSQRQQKLAREYAQTIADKNRHLEKEVNQRTNELLDLASHMTTTSENDKKHLARELHDELGAHLTAARMDTTWLSRHLKPKDDDPINHHLKRLLAAIDQSIVVKRAIITGLVPPLLRELGLIEAIIAMTEDLPQEHVTTYHCELQDDLPNMDSERELALYRICQESLTNIKKYADADNVTIKLKVINDVVELSITDDGKGFRPECLEGGTNGITGMKARAAMFSGVLTIKSNDSKGTSVRARVPLSNIE